jgi:hypothetical protein
MIADPDRIYAQRLGVLRQQAQILHGGGWATTRKAEAKFHAVLLV